VSTTTRQLVVATLGALVLAAACGPAADPAAMASVQVDASGAPRSGCRALASLEGKDTDRWVPGGPYYEKAVTDLRRQAVLGGGNYLFIDSTTPPRDTDYMPAWVVKARLFSCPRVAVEPAANAASPASGAATAAPASSSVALVCEPDCSPGYTCLRGKCVSACNPLCGAGERCGVDRICHPISPQPCPTAAP
jgi:hypothetical protein